jgi:hypothetical protein
MSISPVCWRAALLALAVCGAGASAAQSAAPAPDEAAPADADVAPARPFIERSLVIAPEQVGKFTLQGMNDYPGQPGAGIHVRYRHEDVPDVRLDLFVYPAGRVDREPVLDRAMDELRQSLQHAVDKGSYSNLEIGAEGRFDLRRVDSDGSLLPATAEPAPDPDAGLDEVLAAIDASNDYRVGRRLEARLHMGDEALDSRGYLFYRGLYLVKGRISASAKVLPGEALDRFAHHAMATLVPALSTRSTGGCYRNEIIVDPDAPDMGDVLAKKLIASSARAEQEQCAPVLDETIPEGHRALPLVYPPEAWKG